MLKLRWFEIQEGPLYFDACPVIVIVLVIVIVIVLVIVIIIIIVVVLIVIVIILIVKFAVGTMVIRRGG